MNAYQIFMVVAAAFCVATILAILIREVSLYRLIRPIIFLIPPETAHRLTIRYMKVIQWLIEHEHPKPKA